MGEKNLPSTDPLSWSLFHGDRRLGEMARAHIGGFSISSPFSFHEEVCKQEEKPLVHMNPRKRRLRTAEGRPGE